jgi:hydroxyisourate hydrolase
MSLSTHVLDNSRGEPASGLAVRLEKRKDGWVPVAGGVTDGDGRLRDWVPQQEWGAGTYRLVFATGEYFAGATFFPEVVVTFSVTDPARHHHVPLLLSPYSFTTYRGS